MKRPANPVATAPLVCGVGLLGLYALQGVDLSLGQGSEIRETVCSEPESADLATTTC